MVESSHAFRADRSQHTCLRQIKQQFRNTNWYIVGDTSSCFTKVNHKKCLHLLGHTKKYALQRNRLKPSIQRCVSPFTNYSPPAKSRCSFAVLRTDEGATKERTTAGRAAGPLQQPVLRQLPSFNNKCFAPVTSKAPSLRSLRPAARPFPPPYGCHRHSLAVGALAGVFSSLFALSSLPSLRPFVAPSSPQLRVLVLRTMYAKQPSQQACEGAQHEASFFRTSAFRLKGYAEALEANYKQNKVSPLFRSFDDAASFVGPSLRPLLENTILYALDLFVLRLQSLAAPIKQSHEAKRFALCSSCASLIGATRVGSDDQRCEARHLRRHPAARPAAYAVPQGYESIDGRRMLCTLPLVGPSQKRSSAFTCTCLSYLPPAARPQLHYVRFAHHFLIGVTGSKQYVTTISDMLSRFLQTRLELQLQLDTLQIKHAKQDRVPFLGYLIQHIWPFSRQGGSSKQGFPTKQSQVLPAPLSRPAFGRLPTAAGQQLRCYAPSFGRKGRPKVRSTSRPSVRSTAHLRQKGPTNARREAQVRSTCVSTSSLRCASTEGATKGDHKGAIRRRRSGEATHRRQNRTRMPFQRQLRASPLEAQTKQQRNKLGAKPSRFFRGEALFETKHSALTSIDLLSKKANLSERNHYASKIRLLVNMPKVIHSLAAKGFCDRSGNPKPNFYYFQDSQAIAVARVASVLRGLANYYHLAESRRRCVSRWSYILTHSLAMMFAAKFKLGTRAKVFALAGRNLSKPLLAQQRKRRMLRQKH